MKMGENGVNPHHTEDAGANDHNDRGRKALADSPAGGNGTVHKRADGIAEAHDPRALKSGFNDRLLVGKQGQKLPAEQEQRTAEQRADGKGIRNADEVAFQHAVPLSGAQVLSHKG